MFFSKICLQLLNTMNIIENERRTGGQAFLQAAGGGFTGHWQGLAGCREALIRGPSRYCTQCTGAHAHENANLHIQTNPRLQFFFFNLNLSKRFASMCCFTIPLLIETPVNSIHFIIKVCFIAITFQKSEYGGSCWSHFLCW